MMKNQYKRLFYGFVLVVLLLTFFSKTIYYYLKPQVEAEFVQSGELEFSIYAEAEVTCDMVDTYVIEYPLRMINAIKRDQSNVEAGEIIAVFDVSPINEMIVLRENELRNQKERYIDIERKNIEEKYSFNNLKVELQNLNDETVQKTLLFESGIITKEEMDKHIKLVESLSDEIHFREQLLAIKVNGKDERDLVVESMKAIELEINNFKKMATDLTSIKATHSGKIIMNTMKVGNFSEENNPFFIVVPYESSKNFYMIIDPVQGSFFKEGDLLRFRHVAQMSEKKTVEGVITRITVIDGQLCIQGVLNDRELDVGTKIILSEIRKSENYNQIVPSSAIIKKAAGDYVYLLKSKESLIGKSYYVDEVKVEVLGCGNTKSAIYSSEVNSDSLVVVAASKYISDQSIVVPEL